MVRFQNNKEKWIAFIGLVDNKPYEIFTGLADDEDGIFCPKSVNHGKIIKTLDENGNKRYDFQFINKRGYKTTIEGLSEKFNPEFWNYAKLIFGRAALRNAYRAGSQAGRRSGTRLHQHQHLEDGRGARTEEVYAHRHRGQGSEMSQMRRREPWYIRKAA